MEDPVRSRRKGVPRIRDAAGWMALAFILGPPAAVAFAALSGMNNRWADILAQFTSPALTTVLVMAVVLLAFRRFIAVPLALLVGLALAIACVPQWSPMGPEAAPDSPTIRLYSANVHYLNGDVAAMRRSIQAADPDIVVLIELGRPALERHRELLEGYPYRTASMRLDHTRGPSRTVIASRWPIEAGDDAADGVQAIHARVDTPLGPVNVVGAHLTRPWPFVSSWGQISQTQALTRLITPMEGPVILAGDFNSVSSARIGRQIRADIGLHPAPARLGTYPANLPAVLGVTIDQVYASDELAFTARRLGQDLKSDHRPVIVEITRARTE